jgi:hypothetical protein
VPRPCISPPLFRSMKSLCRGPLTAPTVPHRTTPTDVLVFRNQTRPPGHDAQASSRHAPAGHRSPRPRPVRCVSRFSPLQNEAVPRRPAKTCHYFTNPTISNTPGTCSLPPARDRATSPCGSLPRLDGSRRRRAAAGRWRGEEDVFVGRLQCLSDAVRFSGELTVVSRTRVG